MELWVATSNKNKLSEISVVLKELSVNLKSFSDVGAYSSPPETGKTFEENASIKAKSFRSVKHKEWVIAEDSGLVVEKMNGLPGIHSARYAGDNASDIENNTKLIKMMNLRGVMDRSAKLVACIVAYSPTGERAVFTGEFNGVIAKAPRGTMGFGYDSVFIPQGEEKTLAELGPGYKIQHSHRSKALKMFLEWAKAKL